MTLTREEYEDWWRNPVTQNFLIGLHVKVSEVKDAWARQAYVDEDSAEKSARLNACALTSIDVLTQVIDLVDEARPQSRGEDDS